VVAEVPREKKCYDQSSGDSVPESNPHGRRCSHAVCRSSNASEGKYAQPPKGPDEIISIWQAEHVEQHADQDEHRRRRESQVRQATRTNVCGRSQDDGETQHRDAVDEADREAHGDAGRKLAAGVGCLQELLSGFVQSKKRERIKQRCNGWAILRGQHFATWRLTHVPDSCVHASSPRNCHYRRDLARIASAGSRSPMVTSIVLTSRSKEAGQERTVQEFVQAADYDLLFGRG